MRDIRRYNGKLRLNLNSIETLAWLIVEETVQNVIPIELMSVGECGHVHQIGGCPDLVSRLLEMGLREGARVRMLQPGSPCIVAVNDHRMTFRMNNETALVMVSLDGIA